jgi:thiol-disulfide isomerase/thioredoxin
MLFRTSLVAVAAAIALSGCADPELVAKVDALEKKVAELETRGGGAGPARNPADDAKENEAREGLGQVNKLVNDMNYDEAGKLCAELEKKVGDTQTFRRGGRACVEVAVIGKDAMELDVSEWFQGNASVSGEPTLLVFWEEWCPHCKREVPKLEEMAKQYQGKMKVVGLTKVTRSSTDDSVRKFLAENNVSYPVGKEKNGNLSEYYGVSGVPAAALVKGGKVVWRGHPARLNDDALKKFL